MRYCRIYDRTVLGRTTLGQYAMMMESVRLQKEDELREIHMHAWLNRQAAATKKQGKSIVPYFRSFEDFCRIGAPKPKVSEEEKRFQELVRRANGKKETPSG